MNLTDNIFRRNIALTLAVIALAVAAFSTALLPINSFDFWWHINAGKLILEQGHLPEVDSFTFTAMPDDPFAPGRPAFTLSNAWLSQVIFALTHGVAGLKGIILLRATIYMLIVLTAMAMIRMFGAMRGGILTLPLLLLTMRVALEDTDRPQNFSFLCSFAAIAIIELAVHYKKPRLLFALVPLMFISSNLHGGFIVGLAYIIIYAGCSFFEGRLRPFRNSLLSVTALVAAATYFNAAHWRVFSYLLMKTNTEVTSQISEYASPFSILGYVKGSPGWMAYWALAAIGAMAVMHHLARRRFVWAALTTVTLAASLSSMRFIFFFAPIGAVSAAIAINDLLGERVKSRPIVEYALLVAMSSLIILKPAHDNNIVIRSELRSMAFPVEATSFLQSRALPKRVFSTIGWGGYMEWMLWPGYLLFSDTRELYKQVFVDYFEIMGYTASGRRLLDDYRIETVVIPAIDPYNGQAFPLVLGLAQDDRWALLYNDGQALVFVRRSPGLTDEISKKSVYMEIISETDYWQPFAPWAAGAFSKTRADALEALKK